MPAIDVSFLCDDPDFAEPLTVLRRTETMVRGRAVIKEIAVSPPPMGSIQPKDSVIGGNDVQREPDYIYRGAALLCYTRFRLRGPSRLNGTNYQPDIVVWNGDRFVVSLINDYSQYGGGYIQAELSSQQAMDEPPAEDADGCC